MLDCARPNRRMLTHDTAQMEMINASNEYVRLDGQLQTTFASSVW